MKNPTIWDILTTNSKDRKYVSNEIAATREIIAKVWGVERRRLKDNWKEKLRIFNVLKKVLKMDYVVRKETTISLLVSQTRRRAAKCEEKLEKLSVDDIRKEIRHHTISKIS